MLTAERALWAGKAEGGWLGEAEEEQKGPGQWRTEQMCPVANVSRRQEGGGAGLRICGSAAWSLPSTWPRVGFTSHQGGLSSTCKSSSKTVIFFSLGRGWRRTLDKTPWKTQKPLGLHSVFFCISKPSSKNAES